MTTDMGKTAPPPSPAPSSSLAVVAERRLPHRPGGCTGVLFQLFDWNHHRLASKKLFSRRLLPQARAAKRISKKFAADERMPPAKLLLVKPLHLPNPRVISVVFMEAELFCNLPSF